MLKASYFDKILSFHQVSSFSTEKGLFFSYILVPLRKAIKNSGFVAFLHLFLCTSKMGLSSQETLNVTLNNSSHSHERLKSLDLSKSLFNQCKHYCCLTVKVYYALLWHYWGCFKACIQNRLVQQITNQPIHFP